MIRLLSLILFTLISSTAAWAAPAKKPNIVMVLVDDLDTVITSKFYRKVLPRTMELVADQGLSFTNTFVTTPQCCPSRAAILSGKYGHNTNVLGNGGPHGGYGQFRDDEPTAMPALLSAAGYRTFMVGKYMNGYGPEYGPAQGWTDGAVFTSAGLGNYRGYNYDLFSWGKNARPRKAKAGDADHDYSTDFVRRKAVEFLTEHKQSGDERPFFAYVTPTCPHFPIPPARRHLEKARANWGPKTFPYDRPNYANDAGPMGGRQGEKPEDKPEWLQDTWKKRLRSAHGQGRMHHWMGGALFDESDAGALNWHESDWFNRMGSLYACDEMVDNLVATLKANGQWENTLFVFTSDNGYNLGAHALAQKNVPYEESLRVPLFVTGGAALGLASARKVDSWTLNIDFAPTFLELAGVPVPDSMDGESMLQVLRSGTPRGAPRRQFNIEYHGPSMADGYVSELEWLHFRVMPAFFLDVPTYQAVRAVRDGREYLYVEWNRKQVSVNDRELYDITADPWQLDNLMYHDPMGQFELKIDLIKSLERFRKCKGRRGDALDCARAGR